MSVRYDDIHTLGQVLKTSFNGNSDSWVWVTDYTRHDSFTTGTKDRSWPANLDGRVLKIQMRDNQASQLKHMKEKTFYRIRKLRLKNAYGMNQLQGSLGGMERLVFQLKDDGEKPELVALHQ